MEEKTRKLLKELQNGFKLETRPFKRIANHLGISEEQVLEIIKQNLEQGVIRRIGVAVRPEKLGHNANALVVWQVSPEKIDVVGEEVSAMREVSHCYERECPPGWDYNFFTMIHARKAEQLEEIIKEISEKNSLNNYKIYRTEKELKKTSMRYFDGDDD